MKRIEPYNYYIGVYSDCRYTPRELREKYSSIIVAAEAPREYIVSYRQLFTAALHFLETLYIGRWIRNMDLRFLAFLFQETQIGKIVDRVEESGDKVLIILSREEIDIDCSEYRLPEAVDGDIDMLSAMAIFRLMVEKER